MSEEELRRRIIIAIEKTNETLLKWKIYTYAKLGYIPNQDVTSLFRGNFKRFVRDSTNYRAYSSLVRDGVMNGFVNNNSEIPYIASLSTNNEVLQKIIKTIDLESLKAKHEETEEDVFNLNNIKEIKFQ